MLIALRDFQLLAINSLLKEKCKTSATARVEVAHAPTVEEHEFTTGLIRRENRDHSVLVNNSQI